MTELKPCPFCNAGETIVAEKRMSPRMNGSSEIISVAIRHWCGKLTGIVASHIEYRGRTREDAVAAWNRRA